MKNGLEIDDIGTKRYYHNAKLHREDGPAIEYADNYTQYYLNGIQYNKDEFLLLQFINKQ